MGWFGWGRKANEAFDLGAAIDAGKVNVLATEMLARDLVRERVTERRWTMFRRFLSVLSLAVGLGVSWSFAQQGRFSWPSSGNEQVIAVVQVKGIKETIAGGNVAAPQFR